MIARLALWTLLGVLLVFASGDGRVLAHEDDCPELVTDYSLECPAWSTKCGAGCFYPVCLDCTDASYVHQQTCCAGEVCWDCSYTHYYEISPCILWENHLYGDADDYGFDSFNSPNIDGGIPTTIPGPTDCTDDLGVVHEMDVLAAGVPFDPFDPAGNPAHHRGGQTSMDTVEIGDLPGLVVIAGGVGAPVLDGVNLLGGLVVRLPVSGDLGDGLQYRYWPYSGFVPIEIRVPYRALSGDVTVRDPGLYSFQVRSVNAEGKPSPGSNVVHQVVDGAGMLAVNPTVVVRGLVPGLTPSPPLVTPLPTLESGGRPVTPVILSVVPDPDVDGKVEVTVQAGYVHELEYRWWHHSGFGPRVGSYEWVHVHPVAGKFSIDGLPVQLDPSLPPGAWSGGELPFLFDFQLRSVTLDGVSSELSDVVVQTLWVLVP